MNFQIKIVERIMSIQLNERENVIHIVHSINIMKYLKDKIYAFRLDMKNSCCFIHSFEEKKEEKNSLQGEPRS